MFDVHHAIISANGTINISSFKMSKAKCAGLDTDEKQTRFLRTKMKNKGLHTRWKRHGSWTFMDNAGHASHLYAWYFTQGKSQHKYAYAFEENESTIVFDDLLLMRFPVENNDFNLENHVKIQKEHVKEWLQCVISNNEGTTTSKHSAKKKTTQPKPKNQPKKKSNAKKNEETLVDENIPKNKNTADSDDDSVLSHLSEIEDLGDDEEKIDDENKLEDDLDDVTEHLLLDDDDDVDASEDEVEKWSDDENIPDVETPLDDDTLRYESYTYPEQNLIVRKPLTLSV